MKWEPFFALLFALLFGMIILWMLFPMFSKTLTELNATSTDGNSTAPLNPWIPIMTFVSTPSFLWSIPLFIMAFLVLRLLTNGLSDGKPSYSSEDRPYSSYIESRAEEEEEEEVAQISPTGDLQDLRCPKCGAPLHFQRLEVTTICVYCGLQVQRRTDG